MSSKNERKKGLGRGLSSFLDVDSFDEIVDKKKMKKRLLVDLIALLSPNRTYYSKPESTPKRFFNQMN